MVLLEINILLILPPILTKEEKKSPIFYFKTLIPLNFPLFPGENVSGFCM